MNIRSKVKRFVIISAIAVVALWPASVIGQTEKPELIIRFSPGSYIYNIQSGQDNIFYLEVANGSTQGINNIKLSVNVPEGWVSRINPDTISYLAPGGVAYFDTNITPFATAMEKDYQIAFIAEGDDGVRGVMTTMVRVEDSSSLWLWVGIGVAVAVAALFIFIFRRAGRQ